MYPQYLYRNKSNTSYFFLSYIPKDLRNLFNGRIKFLISLKSRNKVLSKKICLQLHKQTQILYEQIRMGKSLTIDEMKRILRKERDKSKKHSSFFSYVGVDRSKDSKKQEGLDTLDQQEKLLKERSKKDFDKEVLKLLENEGITDIKTTDDSFRIFRENYIKIQSLGIKLKREILKGQTKSQFDLVSQILEDESSNIVDEVEYIDQSKRKISKSLDNVVSEFLLFRKSSLGEKFLQEYQMIFNEFIEIIGNILSKTCPRIT